MLEQIEIDGSLGEGGGQIIRSSVALSSIFKKPIKIMHIRAKRKEPGLRPQHLQSVLAAAKLCSARIEGATVGSTQIEFIPGELLKSFKEPIDTGTAGSVSLIAQSIIPISLFGGITLDTVIIGGTEVPNSPTVDYVEKVVLPIYRKLGAKIEFEVQQRGYYPKGGGILKLRCSRTSRSEPVVMERSANIRPTTAVFSCSRMLPRHVGLRQVESAREVLRRQGIESITSVESEGKSLSAGSSILIYDVSDNCFVGSSALGERGKPSERVGEEAAKNFCKEREYSPNADSHLADMLVTLLCCVKGSSAFTTSRITDHFTTNAEVAKKITGCEIDFRKDGALWQISIKSSSEKPN